MSLTLESDAKHTLEIKVVPKAIPASKESLQSIKGVIGGKQLKRVRTEAVDCPVRNKTVSFIDCFACVNFLRRVKGKVDCKGASV